MANAQVLTAKLLNECRFPGSGNSHHGNHNIIWSMGRQLIAFDMIELNKIVLTLAPGRLGKARGCTQEEERSSSTWRICTRLVNLAVGLMGSLDSDRDQLLLQV
jgi:hypothetical protein